MSDNQFLPDPPQTHKIVPYLRYSHPPLGLKGYLLDKGVPADEVSTARSVLKEMFEYVDLGETVRVYDVDPYSGITMYVAVPRIADEMGKSVSHVQKGMKTLRDNNIIQYYDQDPETRCWKYKLKCYEPAIEYLQAHPDLPKCTVKQLEPTVEQVADREEKAKTPPNNTPLHNVDEVVHNVDTPHPHSGLSNSIKSIKNKETPVSTGLGTRTGLEPTTPTVEEKPGDSLIEEKQEATELIPAPEVETETVSEPEDEDKNSLTEKQEGSDIVHSRQVGEVLDSLTQAKSMNASQTNESIDAFITALNPQAPAVSNFKHAEVAARLKGHLEGVLSAAHIDMPPLLFFKHCLRDMENRIADGKLDTRPSSLNFFLTASTGKDIVESALDNLKSERQAEKTVQKTDTYLQKQRDWGATEEREIPAAAKAELDRLLGRSG